MQVTCSLSPSFGFIKHLQKRYPSARICLSISEKSGSGTGDRSLSCLLYGGRKFAMKVLFIPCSGAISHIIPLLVLYRMLSGTIAEGVFLAVGRMHPLLKKLGFNVLDIDHNGYYTGIRTEIMAYQRYKPDVVVDDASVTTGYATRLTGIPRVAIQRTGVFPGGIPRNKNHRHSLTWISGGTDHF